MWDGEPAVTIGGTNYTGQTLNNAQFTFGAPDFLAGVQPPFGTITLINTTGAQLPIYLSDDVVVTVWNDQKLIRRTLFTGVVSDVSVSLIADDVAFYDITVVGRSQYFESRIIGELGYPSQLDSVRIKKLIQAGTGLPIDLLTGTIDGQGLSPIENYQSYAGVITASPSAFDYVAALPAEAAPAGQLIANFAVETSSWVWEGPEGSINFRPFDALSTSVHTIPPEAVYVDRLRRTSTLTELYNQITINKNENDTWPYSQMWIGNDLSSQGNYGIRNYSLVSQYMFQSNAANRWEPQADYLLEYLANNIQQLDGLVIDLTNDVFISADRNALISVGMTHTINFDLPDDIFDGGTGSGRVCGWSWNIADKILDLTLNLVKVE
jgi:hypothetical protein